MKNQIRNKKQNGITMIALVVSIIVIIILAGASINWIVGDNGLFAKAKEQKRVQAKAEILQELELAKAEVIIDGDGRTDLGKYLNHLNEKGLNSHHVTNIIRRDAANAEITVDGEYLYTAGQVGIDVVINTLGHIDELEPEIDSFHIIQKDSRNIEVEVKARRAEEYEFYIKKTGEEYRKVKEIKTSKKETNELETVTYTYENLETLEEEESYSLKVIAIRGKKKTEQEITGSTELITGDITFGETKWDASTHTASISISTTTSYSIKYQINPTVDDIKNKAKWINYTTELTKLKLNDVIYVCLSDGINLGSYGTNTIKDGQAPTVTVSIVGSNTTNSITASVNAVDNEAGMPEQPTYSYYIKESSANNYGEAAYSGTETSHIFGGLKQNTYYDIKVTTKDKAGNDGEDSKTNQQTGTITTLSIVISDADEWSNTTKTVTITAANDNYSTIKYTTDGTAPTETKGKTIESGGTFTVDKNYTITAIAFDSDNQVGATATNTVTKIDKQAPTVTRATQTTNSVTITATDTAAENESASQVSGYAVTTDTNKPGLDKFQTEATITSLKQGTTYYAWARDTAGNISNYFEVGTESVSGLTISVSNANEWSNTTKTVTITANNSNYKTIKYTIDGTTPTTTKGTTITNGGTFTVDKNYTITAIAFDSDNQVGAAATNTVTKMDKQAPTVTKATATTNSVTITATDTAAANEGASQVSGYAVTTDTTKPALSKFQTSATITSLKQGTTYYAWARDTAGNISDYYQVGKTASVSGLTIQCTNPGYANSGTKTIKITAANSNYKTIKYTTDGTTPTTTKGTTITSGGTFTVDKNCTITAIAFDSDNQVGAAATNIIEWFDTTAPKITKFEVSQSSNIITINLEVEDNESGIARIDYGVEDIDNYRTFVSYITDEITTLNGTTKGSKTITKEYKITDITTAGNYCLMLWVYDVGKGYDFKSYEFSFGEPLADKVEVGDYVAYDATNSYSYTSPVGSGTTPGNGNATKTFTSSSQIKWRVLSKDNTTKQVVLISEAAIGEFTLKGAIGYIWGEKELHNICRIYGHGVGAVASMATTYHAGGPLDPETNNLYGSGARSLTAEDINKIANYTPPTAKTLSMNSIKYATKNSTNGISYSDSTFTASLNEYSYDLSNYISESSNEFKVLAMTDIGNNVYGGKVSDFWLANQMIGSAYSSQLWYNIAYSRGTGVAHNSLTYMANNYDYCAKNPYSVTKGIRPIVYLKTDVKTTGQVNGAWTIVE